MTIKKIIKKFIPNFLLSFYHYLLALIGAVVFGFPGKKLIVIGITGTSGKSTTVDFITRILEEAGNKVVSNSSIRFKIGDKEWKNELKMGMPGRFFMQKLLRQGVEEGCKSAVLEVTSEGIRQHRHKFINFDTVVFTNLSPEHIESHGGFENYRNEKLKLFKTSGNVHIINADDESAKYFLDIPAKKTITFGINPVDAPKNYSDILQNIRIIAKDVAIDKSEILFRVQNTEFKIPVMGEFNIYNALAAIAVAINYGISLDICKKALEKTTGIPGRMEVIQQEPFLVVVDYAHTPVQLEKVYQTFSERYKIQNTITKQIQNPNVQNSKLICVLGSCGGGRDKWKRPVLGKIASQYCKEIILTNEDPYDENPLLIINEIKSGFSQIQNTKFSGRPQADSPEGCILNKYKIRNFRYEKILDRKEAIGKAVKLAKPGDIVIITGKGSETLMCLADGKKIPWSDKEIVKEALKRW